jgi:hypothetical protein
MGAISSLAQAPPVRASLTPNAAHRKEEIRRIGKRNEA